MGPVNGHLLDRQPHPLHRGQRDQRRERNDGGDDDRSAPAERDEEHRAHQRDADEEVQPQLAKTLGDVAALVEHHAALYAVGQRRGELLHDAACLCRPGVHLAVVKHALQ